MRTVSSNFARRLSMGVAMVALLPGIAMAEEAKDDANKDNADIVVTGTLIRGTQVTGAQTISVDAKAITEKAAGSTNELLGNIPQIANTFNGRFEGDPRGIRAGISINRPNLRNLPGYNQATGAVTLVLMDGMRLTPVGVGQSAVDVDIIPAAVLAGVDAVTDGGSSLYGADAVAGVLNFRTMKKFDGVKVDGDFGFGTRVKGFHQWDGTITAGHSWSSGNAYVSVGHADRNEVLNRQLPWASGLVYDSAGNPGFSGTQCISPVGSVIKYFNYGGGASTWTNNPAAPGAGRFPTGTPCDTVSSESYLPQQRRTNVFASLSQELADNIDLRVTAYWTKRDTVASGFPAGGTTTDAPAPNFAAPAGTLVTVQGGLGFSYAANSAYVNRPARLGYTTWGITPELTMKILGDWQLRTSVHFGRSTNFQSFPGADNNLALSYIAAHQLDPQNVAGASASVIQDITNYESDQNTNQTFFMFRSVADGKLVSLPGGDAKLAVGVEYEDNNVETKLNAGKAGSLAAVPWQKASASSKSVFGELSLPVTSFLDLNGSLRYDHYTNFGGTTNPNVGLTLKPTSWLKVYGHWNKSFNAPTAIDALAVSTGRWACPYTPLSAPPPAGVTVKGRPDNITSRDNGLGTCALVLQGTAAGIKPQTAKTWAIGFEANPITGLRFGGEFYAIDFKGALGAIDSQKDSSYIARPDLFIYNADLLANPSILSNIYSQLANGSQVSTQHSLSETAIVADLRTTNLSNSKIEGLDFNASYDTDLNAVHVSVGTNGNINTRARRNTGGVIIDDRGVGNAKFSASTFVGLSSGGASAKVTVNYTGHFTDSTTDYAGNPVSVPAFVVTNLYLGYSFKDSNGALKGTSLRLNVDNVFDVSPYVIKRATTNSTAYANWTLGRVIKLGFSKQF